MQGRVCIITGANRGLGKATAIGLARLGATVVLLCRDPVGCARARAEVRAESGQPAVDSVTCDLASLASVRLAAAEISRRYAAVHVLVNNAGVNLRRRAESVDGLEMTFAVNHLAPFLLTNLLLPLLKTGAPSRIINVTSKFERFGRISFDDLHASRRYGSFRAYAQSKLANVLFTYELAERLRGTGITANCLHPGLVATDLLREWPAWVHRLFWRFLLSPDEGARTAIYLASAPGVASATGKYFEHGGREGKTSRRSRDAETRRRLWRVSAGMTGLDGAGGATP